MSPYSKHEMLSDCGDDFTICDVVNYLNKSRSCCERVWLSILIVLYLAITITIVVVPVIVVIEYNINHGTGLVIINVILVLPILMSLAAIWLLIGGVIVWKLSEPKKNILGICNRSHEHTRAVER